jgi:hypothetical protein
MLCGCLSHKRRTLVFVVLSSLDLLLTWRLLETSDGQVYESNPIASWFLVYTGWLGLVGFKAVAVLFASGLTTMLTCLRPRMGGFILSLACVIVGGVVVYSSSLVGCLTSHNNRDPVVAFQQGNNSLTEELNAQRAYRHLLSELRDDLLARRSSLAEAVRRLRESERGQDERWLQLLRDRHPGLTDDACLAANLVEFTTHSLEGAPPSIQEEFTAFRGAP